MPLSNLALMFGPNLLRSIESNTHPERLLAESKMVNQITSALILNVHRILPRDAKRTSLHTYTTMEDSVDNAPMPQRTSTSDILQRLHGYEPPPLFRRKKIPKVDMHSELLPLSPSLPKNPQSRVPACQSKRLPKLMTNVQTLQCRVRSPICLQRDHKNWNPPLPHQFLQTPCLVGQKVQLWKNLPPDEEYNGWVASLSIMIG